MFPLIADDLHPPGRGASLPVLHDDEITRNTHGRRQFVDMAETFPAECRLVLETLKRVYKNGAVAKKRNLSPQERLRFHQTQSGRAMGKLKGWLHRQLHQRLVKPNSGLGQARVHDSLGGCHWSRRAGTCQCMYPMAPPERPHGRIPTYVGTRGTQNRMPPEVSRTRQAIQYMLNHWRKLTRFLKIPGAPLDNNTCERALKLAILHRKNALFYKTAPGARVGDIFMSLIHTCRLCGVDPFDYLTQLHTHVATLPLNPTTWMPWTYRVTLETARPPADPAP